MAGVNRTLDDPALDDVDHALGRPRNPFNTHRSHYVANANSEQGKAMAASDWWSQGKRLNGGVMVMFHVTQAGRLALSDYLIDHPEKRRG